MIARKNPKEEYWNLLRLLYYVLGQRAPAV